MYSISDEALGHRMARDNSAGDLNSGKTTCELILKATIFFHELIDGSSKLCKKKLWLYITNVCKTFFNKICI